MPYQNNNNRITPDAAKNVGLNPQAKPLNYTIAPKMDFTGVKASSTTIELVKGFGKAWENMQPTLQEKAKEEALLLKANAEAEGNKKEWSEVSKKVTGMAKFNPYLKDSYQTLYAQDIYKEAILRLHSDPTIYAKSSEEVEAHIKNTEIKMLDSFNVTGLQPRHYAKLLEQFNNDTGKFRQNYVIKNSEYNYGITLTRLGAELSDTAGLAIFNTKDDGEKLNILTTTINENLQKYYDEYGIPKTDLAGKVLSSAIESFVLDNPTKVNSATLSTAMKKIEIAGTSINELMPDFDYKISKFVKEVKRADFQDRKLDYEEQQFALKQNTEAATKDYFKWIVENENLSDVEKKQKALEMITESGIEENGNSFLHFVANTDTLLSGFSKVKSNDSTLQELGVKAVMGELTAEEVCSAMKNGKLSWQDADKFIDRLDREVKTEIKALSDDAKSFETNMKKDGLFGQIINPKSSDGKKLLSQKNQIILDLDQGKITLDEAKLKMKDLYARAEEIAKIKSKPAQLSDILNANYIKTQPVPNISQEDTKKAIKKLGFIRYRGGTVRTDNVTSFYNPNRTINGKQAPHRGIDVGAEAGATIWNCNMKGKVVFAGNMGSKNKPLNFIVVQYENGNSVRFLHVAPGCEKLLGKTILPNQKIWQVGAKDGYSTGSHLHTDYWNKQNRLISVKTFASEIK